MPRARPGSYPRGPSRLAVRRLESPLARGGTLLPVVTPVRFSKRSNCFSLRRLQLLSVSVRPYVPRAVSLSLASRLFASWAVSVGEVFAR